MENGKQKQQRPKGNIRIHIETRDLKFPLPSRMVHELSTKEIKDREIRSAIENALWYLVYQPPVPKQRPGEDFLEYSRRAINEMRENAPYVAHFTKSQWEALTDEERKQWWNKAHEEASEDMEAEYGRGVDVKLKSAAGQKRSARNLGRVREKRAGYRARRKTTNRA
jgi:hypothetical protein